MNGGDIMARTEAQNRATYKYAKEHLKRIPLDVQLDEYAQIKAAADQAGESVNGFIKAAIRARLAAVPAGAVPVQAAPLPAGNMAKWDPSAGGTSSCTLEEEKQVPKKSRKTKKATSGE